MNTEATAKTKEGVLGPKSHAFMSVLIYGMLFVTLMVATGVQSLLITYYFQL
ncbi:hypothetical protein [Geomicrobium sp. JCM 19055]|uniref:hypothetical protein n=1 Tax=Geomicrobium sp. JCM 19055 TaxID=1460649 RepID=UPI00045ECC3C|nr:hypothetical protein [Geomicrobium sp. JCM 19055]GAJ97827.1 hypothetical protein JCM19055_708 [Geomicrobium sp. JCM 19055]